MRRLDGRAGVPLSPKRSRSSLVDRVGDVLIRGKWFFIPFAIVLVLAGLVLAATQDVQALAPFVYTAF